MTILIKNIFNLRPKVKAVNIVGSELSIQMILAVVSVPTAKIMPCAKIICNPIKLCYSFSAYCHWPIKTKVGTTTGSIWKPWIHHWLMLELNRLPLGPATSAPVVTSGIQYWPVKLEWSWSSNSEIFKLALVTTNAVRPWPFFTSIIYNS
jgi:hypothetical protein